MVMWQRVHVDHDFCNTYGIKIIAGRDFSRDRIADTTNFIINETACRHLGLTNAEAIGTIVEYDNGLRGEVIGVMSDFHFKTLHTAIEPLIIHIVPSRFRMLTVNVDFADFNKTLEWVKNNGIISIRLRLWYTHPLTISTAEIMCWKKSLKNLSCYLL